MPRSITSLIIPRERLVGVPFRIIKQLPFIIVTNIACLVAFLLLPPVTMLSNGIGPFFFIISALAIMLAASLVLLRLGKLERAVTFMTITLTVACLSVMFMMKYEGSEYEAYRPFAFTATVAVCNMMISLSRRQIYVFFGATIVGWIVFFATIFRPLLAENPSVVAAIFGAGVIGFTLENIILIVIHNLSDELLSVAENETLIARKSFEDLKLMVEGAREGMAIGDKLLAAADDVRRQAVRIGDIQRELADGAGNLSADTANFSRSSEDMLADAKTMQRHFQTQTTVINETSATITEISSNIDSISSIATKRRAGLDDLARGASRQKELLSRLKDGMGSVERSSEGIGGFVQTVQDIASRTALLSMNASIEAARAGASGRGFAVVAQEIRKLSEETQRNAGTIDSLLKENNRTVTDTGKLMDEFAAFVERNTAETSSLIGAIDEILRGISEMDTGASEMVKQVREIVTGTQDSADKVTHVVSGVESQRTAFAHIASFTERLKSLVYDLESAVEAIRASSGTVSQSGQENIEQVKKLSLHA